MDRYRLIDSEDPQRKWVVAIDKDGKVTSFEIKAKVTELEVKVR